jgi:hypothetical protein
MQSAAKRSDGSNIYKLSDHANGDQDASFDHADDITKRPAAAGLSDEEPVASGSSKSLEAPDAVKSAAGVPAAAAPSSADDALAWLKIIQNATADLTADIRVSKGGCLCPFFCGRGSAIWAQSPAVAGELRRSEAEP